MSHRTFSAHGTEIEATMHLADNRCERKHPKRHRTGKRKSLLAKARVARGKKLAAQKLVKVREYNSAVAAYFRGHRETYPCQPI